MPLYEYKCLKCGSVYELLQKVKDAPLKECLKCGSPVRKLISPPALQFKGEGWYVTDYAQKQKPEKKEKDAKMSKSKKEAPAKKGDQSSSSD